MNVIQASVFILLGYCIGRVVGAALERVGPSDGEWLWTYIALALFYAGLACGVA